MSSPTATAIRSLPIAAIDLGFESDSRSESKILLIVSLPHFAFDRAVYVPAFDTAFAVRPYQVHAAPATIAK